MYYAVYGEFVGTCIYFVPIFAAGANGKKNDWDPSFTGLVIGLISGLNLTSTIMCFSNISGANFNPAISFSLWLTGRLSNRKFVAYFIAQLLASVVSMVVIFLSFPSPDQSMYEGCTVTPKTDADPGRIFFTEFMCTFILTYVAFTMAFEEAESLKKVFSL